MHHDGNNVALTEFPFTLLEEREKTAEIMFETFGVASLGIFNESLMKLLSTGRTEGIIVDCEYDWTCIVPAYNGLVIEYAAKLFPVGEKQCLGYAKSLSESEIQHVLDKRTTSEVILNMSEKDFPYFSPSLCGLENEPGLSSAVVSSINSCAQDIRRDLYFDVILSGEPSKRIQCKLHDDVRAFVQRECTVFVRCPTDDHPAYSGASLLSRFHENRRSFISKTDFECHGTSLLHNKCI